MLNFLPLINNLVTIGLPFLLLSISTIIRSKYDQYFAFFIWIVFFSIFINIIHIIRVFNKSFRIIYLIMPLLSCLQLTIDILLHMDLQRINKLYQYLVGDLLDQIINLFFLSMRLQLLIFCVDDQDFVADLDYVILRLLL